MLAIINAELIMKDHLIPEAVILVEDGIIKDYGEMRSTPIPDGCEIYDAEGLYVGIWVRILPSRMLPMTAHSFI